MVVYTGASASWHDDYERGRPGWPTALLDVPGLPAAASVLELGAGTGKLTRLLVRRFADVAAVEPDAGMRRLLARHVPGARLLDGSAEAVPLPDASVDGVFAAESFHLYAWDGAVAELARVLRPGGALVLAWNVPAGPWEPSTAAAERLLAAHVPGGGELGYDPLDLGSRRYLSGEWRAAFAAAPFEPLREARLANPQTVDADALVAFFASMGWIADLPDAERLPLLAEARSLLAAPEYRRPWETQAYRTRRR